VASHGRRLEQLKPAYICFQMYRGLPALLFSISIEYRTSNVEPIWRTWQYQQQHRQGLPVCSWKQMMCCFVGYYTTKRTFYIRTYLRGHKSFTPSVLKLTTSLSFAKLVTWINVTLLSGCIKIVIDYSSTSVLFTYLRMFACIHVCIVCNCNHLRLTQ